MHISIVEGDFIVGYSDEDLKKYEQKVKELLEDGFVLTDTEYRLSGDMHEYFEKDNKVFTITHLAI